MGVEDAGGDVAGDLLLGLEQTLGREPEVKGLAPGYAVGTRLHQREHDTDLVGIPAQAAAQPVGDPVPRRDGRTGNPVRGRPHHDHSVAIAAQVGDQLIGQAGRQVVLLRGAADQRQSLHGEQDRAEPPVSTRALAPGVGEHRQVAALGEPEPDRVFPTRPGVIVGEQAPQSAGVHAHDGIRVGIKIVGTPEDFHADGVGIDPRVLVRKLRRDDEAQEVLELRTRLEGPAGKHPVETGADALRIAVGVLLRRHVHQAFLSRTFTRPRGDAAREPGWCQIQCNGVKR